MLTLAKRRAPVTLIVGGEGFGKIAAAAELVADGRTVVYFTPRPEQWSLLDRVHGFIDAIAPLAPGLRTSFASAAEHTRQAAQPHEELAIWVSRHLVDVCATIVLVNVDGVNDEAFMSFLRAVIESSESTVEWICVARSAPALPWDVWKTYGVFGKARGEDTLRLSRDQALERARAMGFSPPTASELYDITHGWPLGFEAALRLPEPFLRSLLVSVTDARELYELAAREVFSSMPCTQRDVLLQCSVLQEFDEAFAAAAGYAGLWNDIATIARDGILLTMMPGGAVRYRDAFRNILFQQLEQGGESALRAARAQAGAAYEDSGRAIVALGLYAAWNLNTEVLRVCSTHGFALLEGGHAGVLHAALDAVPDEDKKQSAIALSVIAMEEAGAGRYDIAEAWFLQAMAAAQSTAERAAITHRYVLELMRNGRLEDVHLLESYADDRGIAADLRSSIRSTLAIAYVLTQRFSAATATMQAAVEEAERYGDPTVLALVLQHAAWAELFIGDVAAARRTAERAARTALACSLYDCAARAYTVLYNIAYDIDDDPAASITILDAVLDCGMKAGSAPMRLFALLGMFDLATERGDAQQLQRIERALASYELSYGDPMTSAALVSGQALFLAGNGKFSEAYDLLVPSAERQITADRRALRFSELALYAAAANRTAEAMEALTRVEQLGPELKHDRRMLRALANVVLAYMLVGNTERAAEIQAKLAGEADATGNRGRAFVDAVDAVARRWNGARNRSILHSRFDTLSARELGGFSAVLTALPLQPSAIARRGRTGRSPKSIAALIDDNRERIIAAALENTASAGAHTLLADLIAAGVVERVSIWLTERNDREILQWAEQMLQRQQNAFLAAQVFGDTITACVNYLRREAVLDEETEVELARVRDMLDMHLSALQVRGAVRLTEPDPVDAEIFNLLERLKSVDPLTHEHSRCVGAWCARLAKRMHLTKTDSQLVMRCGLIHDVGKLLTPAEILQAPRRLSADEWYIMRRHTLDGVRLLEPLNRLHPFIPAVRWHHERFDGKGYPDAIPLQDIPFAARIVAVADAFNAMIARRPYREPLQPMVAIEELKKSSGTQFDPAVVAGMIEVVLRPDQ